MRGKVALPARVISVQVGRPQVLQLPGGRPLRTGLLKSAIADPVHVGEENLEGDGQGDLRYHGGPDKAVCILPREHYPLIEQYLGYTIPPGAFGENLTTTGLCEQEVCVGD